MLAGGAIAWWLLLAPRALGGPATFVIVSGQSMEPMLHTGDLVIARAQTEYRIGDLAVFQHRSGHVIHRIIGGSPTGWRTQGDNKPAPDPWTIPSSSISGTFWFSIPGVGGATAWFIRNWWAYAALITIPIVLSYVPWRRRRIVPVLADALSHAERERRALANARDEQILFAVLATLTLASGLGLAVLVGVRPNTPTPWLVGGFCFLALAAATVVLALRVFDGIGIAEPERSLRALSGRLYRVEALPALEPTEPVRSASQLRTIAERERLPVLHLEEPNGRHCFAVISAKHGCFSWVVHPT